MARGMQNNLVLEDENESLKELKMFPQQAALDTDDLSGKYFERAVRVSPGGVHSPVRAFRRVGGTPIFFHSAQGAKLTSVDGCEYIAFCQSFGRLLLGDCAPAVRGAVVDAIETFSAPRDDKESLRKISNETGMEIAAVILEPLPANYGLLIQRREFIEETVRIAHEHGALVIFDEVISGFRVAVGGMAEVLG